MNPLRWLTASLTLATAEAPTVLSPDKVSNPISQSYIDNKIKSKEQSKITNKLIRNEDMTKQEALKAKKKLKENSLPPALSTRSQARVLRSSR